MPDVIQYTPPPTVSTFIQDHRKGALFYDWIVGPVGSGKTTGNFFKLCYMAQLQEPGPDGIRRTRAVIVRNTAPQLRDTTLASWFTWFREGQAGSWHKTENKFVLKFGDVECEVLFRPLDSPEDIARVLSLEVTFAILDEFVEIPREIVDALSSRLGRYPAVKDGGATNWGMWGASNTSTEDNWWFDYLHDTTHVMQSTGKAVSDLALKGQLGDACPSATHFRQPSGFDQHAENLANLPGGREYYVEQAKNKKKAWIKQFIEVEWGFSASGQPVVSIFNPALHIAKTRLKYNPLLELVIGLDPGLGGMGWSFTQQDLDGRLLYLGELVLENVGVDRAITNHVKPYLRQHFPEAQVIIAPDPAAAQRSQTDERAVVEVVKRHFEVKIETNNRLPLRVDAIDYYAGRLTELGMALQIDQAMCPHTARAFAGGWRYAMAVKRGVVQGTSPEKNRHSHIGDAAGYAARYHHKQDLRYGSERARLVGSSLHRKPFVPQRAPGYHFR